MTRDPGRRTDWFASVLHPTDFSAASDTAFAHALALAVVGRAKLTIMHVTGDDDDDAWPDFPPVRETLVRWGLLEPGSPAGAVFERLGTRVKKILVHDWNPLAAILDYMADHDVDLLVLATEGREGLPRWLGRSVAEPLARESGVATLFVPQGIEGFVPLDDAAIHLQRIVVPVDTEPDAGPAIRMARRLAGVLGDAAEVSLVHVGERWPAPGQHAFSGSGGEITLIDNGGDVASSIAAFAREVAADLIVVPTAGHHGVLDALRGSTSEQLVRRSPCAVLAVPVD